MLVRTCRRPGIVNQRGTGRFERPPKFIRLAHYYLEELAERLTVEF
jgi:hypothetical protein